VIGVIRDIGDQRLKRNCSSHRSWKRSDPRRRIAHEIGTPMQYVGDNVRFLGEGVRSMARVLLRRNASSTP
jgi:hypothetical protein